MIANMFTKRFKFPAASFAPFRSATQTFTPRTPKTPFTTHHFPQPRQGTFWQRSWQQSQQRSYRRQAFNYHRFQIMRSLFRRWAARPTFYYEVGGIGILIGSVYIYNLEPVPISGRRRFNIVSPEWEASIGSAQFQQTMQEYGNKIMSTWSKEHRQVQRVLERLLPHVPEEAMKGQEWEVRVIDDDLKNAFVIPGGKVFVFRGILDVCQGDDGLAAVLGHEIAHNVAHHAAERLSQSSFVMVGLVLASLAGVDMGISDLLTSLAFTLPGGRKQESEADYIGLLMMAESCYNPEAAVGLWLRMEEAEKEMGGAPPQFLSTHPSSHNRVTQIREWLPEAEVKYESRDCSTIRPFANDFRQAAGFARW